MRVLIPSLLTVEDASMHQLDAYWQTKKWNKIGLFWGEGIQALLENRIKAWIDSQKASVLSEATIITNQLDHLLPISFSLPADVQVLLAIGGGKVIDCCKYTAHLLQKPLVVFPTSISNDGFCSPTSSLIIEGKRRTVKAVPPDALIFDPSILAHCPSSLLFAGVGDLFCKYTALFDWRMAYQKNREPFHPFAATISRYAVEAFDHFIPKDFSHPKYLSTLFDSLMMTGLAIQAAGSSRPASGSEHLISHAYDQVAQKPSLHGLQVGVASYAVASLQKETFQQVCRCAEESGFFDYLSQCPLSLRDFCQAIRHAPYIKENFYTILSEPLAIEKLLDFCSSDTWMKKVLATHDPQ